MLLEKLYTEDSTGKIRTWQMEVVDNSYRTISGVSGGALVKSDWTYTYGKNFGKKNETSPEEQAALEVRAKYVKQKKKGYSENINNAGKVEHIKPMLAKIYKDYKDKIDFDNDKFVVQTKLNGARCIATYEGLFSRTGEKFLTCPHIENSLKSFFNQYPDAVLDGELFNFSLREKLNEIMSLIRKTVDISKEDYEKSARMISFYVYDGFNIGGMGPEVDYSKRKKYIDSKIVNKYGYLSQVKDYPVASDTEIMDLYNEFIGENHEGAILRKINSPYKSGRSKDLLKIKPEDDAEFLLVDVREGEGNWSGKAKILTLKMKDGREFDATFKGTMVEAEYFLGIYEKFLDKYVTIKYNGVTAYGKPNFGQFDFNNQKFKVY